MNIAESSVKFPITVIVRVLLVLVFGYVCLTFLTVELKPDTEQPTLVVATTFPGAAPEEVEGEITTRFRGSHKRRFKYALHSKFFGIRAIVCSYFL